MENISFPAVYLILAILTLCIQDILRRRPGRTQPNERAAHGVLTLALCLLLSVSISIGGSKGPPSFGLTWFSDDNHPAWYLRRGYNTNDSDGDGIPDAWERWTRTNPAVDDATQDPDGDGVSNLEEFIWQCDPMRRDTDGDFLSDRVEIDGADLCAPDLDPLVPATYSVEEPDVNDDGVPDIWGRSYDYAFAIDRNENGYPDSWEWFYDDVTNGVDVVLHITSSRSCVLETGIGDPLFLPVCTNRAVRVRFSGDGDSTIRLLGAPDGVEIASTWKARMRAEWAPDQGLEIDGDRIRAADGAILDLSDTQVDFAGALVGHAPPRQRLLGSSSVAQDGDTDLEIMIREKFFQCLRLGPPAAYCSIHGPALTVQASGYNVEPPYLWSVPDCGFSVPGGDTFTPADYALDTANIHIVCEKRDDVHGILPLRAEETYHVAACHPARTNIVGAAWTSTHNPADASDHEPGVFEEIETFGPNCPVHEVTNTIVRVGYTHDPMILHIRNLIRILTGDPWDDETDHCIGVLYQSTGTIDLYTYLSDVCTPYRDNFTFRVSGKDISGHIINMKDYKPVDDLRPTVLHVSFVMDGGEELDYMWLVLYADKLQRRFDSWCTMFASTAWTTGLPPVYPSILLSTNSLGKISIASHTYPGWKSPTEISSFLHHNAKYEMRSNAVGAHGHQATYDKDGILIEDTIAAGTADYHTPLSFSVGLSFGVREKHYTWDVIPFLRAASLDGNPGIYNHRYAPTNVDRPCLYQGTELNKYIQRRPILPAGKH